MTKKMLNYIKNYYNCQNQVYQVYQLLFISGEIFAIINIATIQI